ncbi:citrate lyase subunit alpha [Serratia ureilytica]|nr:citrate lyase subunit alpha [Serratia ureilytica]
MNRQQRLMTFANPADLPGYQDVSKANLQARKPRDLKLCDSLQEAVRRSGLQDGMTISFHHAFRGGDLALNQVMETLAAMGFRNLTLASSSLTDCHAPLVEHIRHGVVSRIYTSGLRGPLADAVSRGLLAEPVQIHSHGGRVNLIESGELKIDVAFLGVPACDEFGNANGYSGEACCGSLGYARVDAEAAGTVVLLTEQLVPYPHHPASLAQDRVDLIVQLERVGDADKIGADATRMTSNPRELLIARRAAEVIAGSGYFTEGFSLQTGTGGASLAVTRFLEDKMRARGIRAAFALGGITSTMVDLHEKGLIGKLLDVQSFDRAAATSLARNPRHIEISANQYANFSSKGASVDRLDVVVLSALEIDTGFNVNVLTGSDGVLRGASGGHCDTAAAARLAIIVAPLVRGRIPTLVEQVTTCVTPGSSIDILVTDHGIAVNPARPELAQRLREAGLEVVSIDWLRARALQLTGEPQPIAFTDKVVAVVRYRDGSVIDVVHQVAEYPMAAVDPHLAADRAVSRPERLTSRECRQARQQAWLAQYECTLLVLTLVVPGPVKDSALTRGIFNLGWAALLRLCAEQGWPSPQAEALALATGCEGFVALRADAQRVKDCAMQLEVSRPIGRLWDIDVLDAQGRILSRRDIGLPARRCLLCGQPAKICARQRRHGSEQLLQEMERMFNDAISAD